ncbi:voltage-dependent calcium channel subunit alpha-2/delta-2-like [Liolophura sinensis]|uniref:voltage-dependent calcium channel subunit alpha-2/delta-2-like n=1 Tax=Liolophura sinensis TaxID=3198878 RepID=UPI0031598EFF
MATIGWVRGYLMSLLVIAFLSHGVSKETIGIEDKKNEALEKAERLSQELNKFYTQVLPHAHMEKKYNESTRIKYEKVDGLMLVKEMAATLGEILGKKVEGLRNAVKKAENIAKYYKWNKDLKIGTVEYVNSKLLKRNDNMLQYNPIFNQAVNMSVSSVHIPVEIYEGNIDILNGLKWTADLDKVFQENREKDPDLLWQFFGSQTGFMRTMPASRWRCFGEVDLYDVRRRPWYTQGSSSPKDMLILIDRSGSVHGQALQLIKVAVQSLLDTLGDNDFFNIIKFSSKVGFVHDCFNHTFVQANYRNKRILQNKVADLKAYGKADFKNALTFAFEQFQRFRENDTLNQGAKCNEVIMLLTDGGSDKAKEVFEKYNWPNNKSVRVFTYTIGSTSDPTDSIRWMACANRGFFSPIPAMGAIRSKVQDYVKVLSRPLALTQPRDFMWTSVYKDSMGLGMMTTVTLPVYNKSVDASNQTILGVMGVDVTTRRLMEATPMEKLTPNGYSFAINQNGYIIFHPDLKAQNGWLQDPPNVDFLDLEYETEDKEELRRRMISGEEGHEDISTFLVQVDQKHIIEVNRTYFFTSINNSDFSLGLVIPEYAEVYPVVEDKYSEDEGFKILEDIKDTSLVAMKDYYVNYTKGNRSDVTGMLQDLLNSRGSVQWDDDLLQHLFWDADISKKFNDVEQLLKGNFAQSWKGVRAVFLGTDSGLTRFYPQEAAELLMDERDTSRTPYYKRALETDDFIFIAPPDGMIDGNDTIVPDVTMVKAISIKTHAGNTYKPAVMGLKMEHSKLLSFMSDISMNGYTCNDSDRMVCYLLDDGGFVIATNQEDKYAQVGHFLGTVDNALMYPLVNDSTFYDSKTRYDYQASCPDQQKKSSIAGLRSLRIPTFSMLYEFLSVNWWSSQITWAYINFNLYNWLFGPSSSTAYAQQADVPYNTVTDDEEDEGTETDCSPFSEDTPTNHSCTKVETHYYFVPDMKVTVSSIYCENCTREFRAARVGKTNLLLLIADSECMLDECPFYDIPQAPREDETPDDCQINMRYRRRPEGCYSRDANEDDTKCGSITHQPSSLSVLIATVITLLISRHFTQVVT